MTPVTVARFKKANEKFLNGDNITDSELTLLIDTYEDIEQKLAILGPHFHLAYAEVMRKVQRLNAYASARERNG